MINEINKLMDLVWDIYDDSNIFKQNKFLNRTFQSVTRKLLLVNAGLQGIGAKQVDNNLNIARCHYNELRYIVEMENQEIVEKFDRLFQLLDAYVVYLKLDKLNGEK